MVGVGFSWFALGALTILSFTIESRSEMYFFNNESNVSLLFSCQNNQIVFLQAFLW